MLTFYDSNNLLQYCAWKMNSAVGIIALRWPWTKILYHNFQVAYANPLSLSPRSSVEIMSIWAGNRYKNINDIMKSKEKAAVSWMKWVKAKDAFSKIVSKKEYGVCVSVWMCVCTSLHACVKGGEQMGIICQYFYYCHYSAASKASYKSKCFVMDNWWASKFCWIATFSITSLGLCWIFSSCVVADLLSDRVIRGQDIWLFFTTTICKKRPCYTMIYRMFRLLTC